MGNVTLKTVNIKANIPIKNVTPPIYGVREGIKMTPSDILKCLCKRAIVDEVLSDGSTVRLTTKNFHEDFEGKLQEAKQKAKQDDEDAKAAKRAARTGKLPNNLLDMIDKDDDDHNGEPEEAGNVVIQRNYIDGTQLETVGVTPSIIDPEDNQPEEEPVTEETPVVENPDAAVEGPAPVVEEEKSVEDATPTVNTKTDAPDTTAVTQKANSNKKNRRK